MGPSAFAQPKQQRLTTEPLLHSKTQISSQLQENSFDVCVRNLSHDMGCVWMSNHCILGDYKCLLCNNKCLPILKIVNSFEVQHICISLCSVLPHSFQCTNTKQQLQTTPPPISSAHAHTHTHTHTKLSDATHFMFSVNTQTTYNLATNLSQVGVYTSPPQTNTHKVCYVLEYVL